MSKKRTSNKNKKKLTKTNKQIMDTNSIDMPVFLILDYRYVMPATWNNIAQVGMSSKTLGKFLYKNGIDLKGDDVNIDEINNLMSFKIAEYNDFVEQEEARIKNSSTERSFEDIIDDLCARKTYKMLPKSNKFFIENFDEWDVTSEKLAKEVANFKSYIENWDEVITFLEKNRDSIENTRNTTAYIIGVFEKYSIRQVLTGVLQKQHFYLMEPNFHNGDNYELYEKDIEYGLSVERFEIEMFKKLTDEQIGQFVLSRSWVG